MNEELKGVIGAIVFVNFLILVVISFKLLI